MRTSKWLAIAAMLWVWATSAPSAAQTPQLQLVATYSTGLTGDNAEVISVRADGVAVASNTAGSIDVLDLSNPFAPRRLIRVPVDTTTGTPNPAAVHPQLDYFLTVTGRAGQIGTVSAFGLFSGVLLDSAPVGIQPDAVVISPDGLFAVVTNEAEGSGAGRNGGEGSLSVIDLGASHAAGRLVVRHVALPAIVALPGVSAGRTDDLAVLPIDNLNVVLRLDLHTGDMPAIGLGSTTDAADLTNGGGYAPPEPLTALREPDGIAVDPSGRFFVTADEGDTRNAAGQSGARGGRTISVFDAQTGALIADTGTQLDDAAAAVGAYPDQRSNRGWSEAAVHGYSSRAGTK